jgi:predicted MFS family arabinose efflux permease
MPLIGAVGEISWRWAWLAFPLVAAVVAGITIAHRPATPRTVEADSLTEALRDPPTARWILGELLSSSAWIGTLVFSGALFTDTYGVTSVVTGVALAVAAAAYAAGNVFFRRVVECRARLLIVRLALLLALGVALFGLVRPAPWVSAIIFSGAAFVAGGRTLIGSAVGLEATPERRRAVMGARAAANQLGYFVGSAIAGAALAAGGFPAMGLTLAGLFLVSAVPFLIHVHGRGDTTLRAALLEPACPGS